MAKEHFRWEAYFRVSNPEAFKGVDEVLMYLPFDGDHELPVEIQQPQMKSVFQNLARSGFEDTQGRFWPPQSIVSMVFHGLCRYEPLSVPPQ